MSMRELKFRAWDGEQLVSCDGLAFYQDEKGWRCPGDANIYILIQYTGLKDKNGEEIYEGDVVGKKGIYHFIERDGWEVSVGNWKITGEESANLTGEGIEKFITGFKLYIVEWKDTSCGFEPFSDSDWNCGHCDRGMSSKDVEVIGNIYENPEILSTK